MPAWNPKEETMYDSVGKEIRCGDVLVYNKLREHSDSNYLVCYSQDIYPPESDDAEMYEMEVRDLSCNNVNSCELGVGGNVTNIGHFTKHLDKLTTEDLHYYFGIDTVKLKFHRVKYIFSEEG